MNSAALRPMPDRVRNPRAATAAGAVALTALAALLMALFSTEQAVGGGWAERALIPARMLLLVVAATFLLRVVDERWSDVGLSKPGSYGRTAALVLAGYFGVGLMFAALSQLVLPPLGLAPKTASMFAALEGNTAEYLYWLLPVAWGSAAFGEELVFRGFLQTRIEKALGAGRAACLAALAAQAVVFGALHAYQGIGGAMLAGGTGLVLGIVYLAARRNLWAPIILHGLVDTVTLTAVYYGVAGSVA